ncbi:hypothetical protein bpmyx0001_16090 [Bacillus pseudomycoides DSM 12442]|nr:hypothetical protein bpmyx0001_16090 [Bacillus pseudomycoides DSM 12442]
MTQLHEVLILFTKTNNRRLFLTDDYAVICDAFNLRFSE